MEGTMEIVIEKAPRCHWHTNCPQNRFNSGVLKIVRHEEENQRTIFKCLHCGEWGYVPFGQPFFKPFCSPILAPEPPPAGEEVGR